MVSGSSKAPLPARCGAFFRDPSRVTAAQGQARTPQGRLTSLHDSVFFRTRREGRAVHDACSAADVRCRKTQLAGRNVAGNTVELVQQLCAAPRVSRRLSRMGHLANGGSQHAVEVQETRKAN